MASCNMTLALAVAGVMLAGPALAQATTGRAASGAEIKGMKSRSARSGRKGVMAMAGDEKVKAVQQALGDKGHHPGSVDGRMGPKTQQALRDFQKTQGMKATGHLDTKTMQSLGVEVSTTSSAESTTSGSASPASGSTIDTPKK